ncbi:MAG: glycosyltransferase [Flavobacteriales bacterium]
MESPILTVVLPVKDNLDGLSKTLSSLRRFSRHELEVVVVDGTDETGDEIRQKLTPEELNSIHLCSGSRSGVYPAMNQGVQAGSGIWVLFLGAGDVIHENTLTTWLQKASDHDCETLFAFSVSMGADREAGVPDVIRPKWGYRLMWQNTIHHQGLLSPRSWFDEAPFDESMRVLADYKWVLERWLEGRKMTPSSSPLTTCASGGLSRQFNSALYHEEWSFKRKLLPLWAGWLHLIWLPAKFAFKKLA